MKFLTSLRSERILAELKATQDLASPPFRKAVARLIGLGRDAIPIVIDALPTADKRETMAFVEVLGALADPRTLPTLLLGLSEPNPRTVAAISWALSGARGFPPNLLLEALKNPEFTCPALMDVIAAHKARLPLRDLLAAAYSPETGDKAGLFKIIGEVADEASVPDLLSRLEGKDVTVRVNLVQILSRFNTPEVQEALLAQLKDPNKLVRQAVLAALLRMPNLVNVAPVAPLLGDPDMEVSNRAVEILIRARNPETVRYLVPLLQDESEYARRAAVEVLNEVGDPSSIKYLLDAIKDSDWWVRSRAADALGKIGGPRVVDAVLELVKDKDNDIRRTAIEILNLTKDERAVDHLLQATQDSDWWVCERAVDALADIGSLRAVPRLIEMLRGNAHTIPATIRALAKLGDSRAIEGLLTQLTRTETEIRVEALHALAKLSDDRTAETIRTRIRAVGELATDQTVSVAASRALQDLDARFSATQAFANRKTEAIIAAPARTMLIDNADVRALVEQNEAAAQRLDISTLTPGDILDGRYKYIEKIGKGAFGTVLLMEDTVVDERLILKFLNPAVSQDEEMMKRFVHELRYSRKITHRNVIRIYDFLFIRGNYAISMEYFPSHTLGQEIVNEQPMPIAKAVQYGIDIATGMTVAHQVGIVHRDLKPANVLINDDGLLKVVDFGVAAAQKEGDAQLTKTGYVIGSPKYMAPEQILGKPVDPRADIYSTGVILYEMLTGVPPYSRGDHMAVMYQHVQGKARPPIEINPRLPQQLSDLVAKAMAVDKMKRYQSMDELRSALEHFI
ncbi:MAG: HEAT repeat domain-containing protein [Proteobacteria bacterium]|nr:HEAT repeat domain-containing protein [Pseudomonadota bacterium]